MSINVAINGLGRIGRCILKAVVESDMPDINIVAANGTAPIEDYITLLKYDSVHGKLREDVKVEGNALKIGRHSIRYFTERDPTRIPWDQTEAELVFECTGQFQTKTAASGHMKGKVKHVIIASPSEEIDATIVFGVNNHTLKPHHTVISIGSCTTNALAPIAKVLNDAVGIEVGYVTTIHAYTNDQNLLDNRHKDPRRARTATLSMIPTSTGAAKTIGKIIPELENKLSGSAVRVPVPNVSMIDLCFTSKKSTSKEEINAALESAANGFLRGVISIAETQLVSIDFNHTESSAIFDPFETHVIGGNFVRVVAWYDNEWGFSHRMLDVARLFAQSSHA